MAISDGFEVWLKRLDEELAANKSGKTHFDFEPLQLLRAYENSTPAGKFASDPQAPILPPKGWRNRVLGLANAARFPYFHLAGLVICFICVVLILEEGMKAGFWKACYDLTDGLGIQHRMDRTIRFSPEWVTIGREMDANDKQFEGHFMHGAIYTFAPTGVVWIVICTLCGIALGKYLRLNYKVEKKLTGWLGRVGVGSKVARFPDI